jgi:hypothetical protein
MSSRLPESLFTTGEVVAFREAAACRCCHDNGETEQEMRQRWNAALNYTNAGPRKF